MEKEEINEMMEKLRNTPITFERQVIQEPDFHFIALEQAGKLDNKNLYELLGRAEEIEKWLNEPERLRREQRKMSLEEQQKIFEAFRTK